MGFTKAGFFIWMVIFCSLSFASGSEFFWICYYDRSGFKQVMQINNQGRVLLEPTTLNEGGAFHVPKDLALSFNGDKTINLWYSTGSGESRSPVYRLVFDKRTLKTKYIVQTTVRAYPSQLSQNHQSIANRLAVNVPMDHRSRVVTYPVGSDGRIAGKGWYLSPPLTYGCIPDFCNGGIGGSGRLAFWFDFHPTNLDRIDMFIRPLGLLGHPIAPKVILDHITDSLDFGEPSHFGSADASRILPGNRMFVVYVKVQPDLGYKDKILLQAINPLTGAKRDEAIVLHAIEKTIGQVKIDASGRFIIFGETDFRTGIGALYFLALDSNGHASGRVHQLVPAAVGDFDLLRDNDETY